MKLLFVKGDRGLVANKNGMFYFPDRKSNIKEEGLYECEISVDKEKYAFVTGKLIKTQLPLEYDVRQKLERLLMDKDSFTKISGYYVKQIGASIICFTVRGTNVMLSYVGDNNMEENCLSYMTDYKRDYQIKQLYAINKFADAEGYETVRRGALADSATILEGDMVQKVVAVVAVKHSESLCETITRFQIVDDRFILIETEWHSMKTSEIYIHNEKYGVVRLPITPEDCFGTKCIKMVNVDMPELGYYIIQNHLGAEGYDDSPTYTKQIAFMGDVIKIECINGKKFLDDISEADKQKVAASFDEYEKFRKKVGKHISKSMIPEMAKLSPMKVLGIKGWR